MQITVKLRFPRGNRKLHSQCFVRVPTYTSPYAKQYEHIAGNDLQDQQYKLYLGNIASKRQI